MSDDIIGTIVQEILKYHELTPTSQKNYQMDRVQYSQALSDPNWNPKKGVQNNFVLPVAISLFVALIYHAPTYVARVLTQAKIVYP